MRLGVPHRRSPPSGSEASMNQLLKHVKPSPKLTQRANAISATPVRNSQQSWTLNRARYMKNIFNCEVPQREERRDVSISRSSSTKKTSSPLLQGSEQKGHARQVAANALEPMEHAAPQLSGQERRSNATLMQARNKTLKCCRNGNTITLMHERTKQEFRNHN